MAAKQWPHGPDAKFQEADAADTFCVIFTLGILLLIAQACSLSPGIDRLLSTTKRNYN